MNTVETKVACKFEPTEYGDNWVIPPEGYRTCRLINGQPCNCKRAITLVNGNCPCAPGDSGNPVVLVAEDLGAGL
jgi:hypothetical protein